MLPDPAFDVLFEGLRRLPSGDFLIPLAFRSLPFWLAALVLFRHKASILLVTLRRDELAKAIVLAPLMVAP